MGVAVKLRVARKIRKGWGIAFSLETKIASHRFQREHGAMLAGMLGVPEHESRVVVTKAERKLYLRGTPRYDQQQVRRAYFRLEGEERINWRIDMAVVRVRQRPDETITWTTPGLLARAVDLLKGQAGVSP